MQRINKYDTLKGILILLMVLGHVIGSVGGGEITRAIRFWLYTFHMPLFMCISGRFAQFKPAEAAIYALLSVIFEAWFVLVLALYYCCIPLLARVKGKKQQLAVFVSLIAVGLLAGFLPLSNKHTTLMRCFTFAPYFVLGYYRICEWKSIKHKRLLGMTLFVFTLFIMPMLYSTGHVALLLSDQYMHHFLGHRTLAYIIGVLWIWWFLNTTTNHHIPVFTKLGKCTLWIYLLHEPMLPMVKILLQSITQAMGAKPLWLHLSITVLWILLLWPVAMLLQRGLQIILKQCKPLNKWFQRKCMPK